MKLRILKKAGLLLMAIGFSLTACTSINRDTASEVCKKLQEKYGVEFEATHIGNRLGSTSAKLYIKPENDPEVVFTAYIDAKTREVVDDYAQRKVNCAVEKRLTEHLETECFVRSLSVTKEEIVETDLEIAPKEFLKKHSLDGYTIYLIVNGGSVSGEKILARMEATVKELGVQLYVLGYVLESENYQSCVEELSPLPGIGSTAIRSHSPISEFTFSINAENCTISLPELEKKLGGD